MVLFQARAPKSTIATAAAIILSAFCGSVGADALDDAANRERELVTQIQAAQLRDGPYTLELLDPLRGLSLLYQEVGDHSLALVSIERALHVLRVNHGLHTLEQVPLIFQKILSEEARGNDPEVWALEQDLLALLRRHSDDVRTAQPLRRMADRQMATLREYLDGEKPPDVEYGCFYKQWPNALSGSCQAGSRRVVVQGMLAEAQRNYAESIAIMLRQNLYDSEELRDIEMELLRGVELVRTLYEGPGEAPMPMVPMTLGAEHVEPWESRMAPLTALATWDLPPSSEPLPQQATMRDFRATPPHLYGTYHRGRQSLSRLSAYEAASASSTLTQAEALAQIADWDLLYSQNGQALEGYEVVFALLKDADLPPAAIAQLFAPTIPVVLPAFEPNPLEPDATRPVTGHADVTFAITKFGRARDVELHGAANASNREQRHLVRLIKKSRFRPQLTDGMFADSKPVSFRYYFHDEREMQRAEEPLSGEIRAAN